MFVPCKRKSLNSSRYAGRCRPISEASSIQQAVGGCCRSTLRAPGRRKPKNAALWVFKQCAPWDLQTWSICQFIHVGRAKQKKCAVWRATKLLSASNLEVINSLNHYDPSSQTRLVQKLQNQDIYTNFRRWEQKKHSGTDWRLISTFLSETNSRPTDATPKISHNFEIRIKSTHNLESLVMPKWQGLNTAQVSSCVGQTLCGPTVPLLIVIFSSFSAGVYRSPAGHRHQWNYMVWLSKVILDWECKQHDGSWKKATIPWNTTVGFLQSFLWKHMQMRV